MNGAAKVVRARVFIALVFGPKMESRDLKSPRELIVLAAAVGADSVVVAPILDIWMGDFGFLNP
jgi:hypothetical protein